MTQQQKRLLLIWAVLDVAVIIFLGSIAANIMLTPPPEPVTISPCTEHLLDALPKAAHPSVSWTAKTLYVHLDLTYRAATPPSNSAQHLWTTLDALASTTAITCSLPQTLILTLNTHGETQTIQHSVQLSGPQVEAWAREELPEETLATQAKYRQISSARVQPQSKSTRPR